MSVTPSQPPSLPKDICPHCGALGYQPAIKLKESFNIFAFLTGGIWAVVLLNAGRAKRVKCNTCGGIFSVRPTGSKISLLLFWLLIAPGILFLSFFLLHELWSLIHG